MNILAVLQKHCPSPADGRLGSRAARVALAAVLAAGSILGSASPEQGQAAIMRPHKMIFIPGLCDPSPLKLGECGLLQNPIKLAQEDETTSVQSQEVLMDATYLAEAGARVLATDGRALQTFRDISNALAVSPTYGSTDAFLAFNYSPDWAQHPTWYYGRDTWDHLSVSSQVLSQQLSYWRSLYGPGVVFDIIAHSMGGNVAAYWAAAETDRANLAAVHSITTVDSPLTGIGLKGALAWLGCAIIIHCVSAAKDLLDSQVLALIASGARRADFVTIANQNDDIVDYLTAFLNPVWRSLIVAVVCRGDCHSAVLRDPSTIPSIIQASATADTPLWFQRQVNQRASEVAAVGSVQVAVGTSVPLTARLLDGYGQSVGGKSVTLASSRNITQIVDNVRVQQNTVTDRTCGCAIADQNGAAQFTVSSATPGTATITAVDVSDGWLPVGSPLTITFTANPPPSAGPTAPGSAPVGPSPSPAPSGASVHVKYAGGEGATRTADFKFSVGQRADGIVEGWLTHAPKVGDHFVSAKLNSIDSQNGSASVWGIANQSSTGRQYPFNLFLTEQTYQFTAYDGATGATARRDEGTIVGGAVRIVSAPPPSSDSQPQPGPVYPPILRYVGGEGAIESADFKFSIGTRPDGGLEGWLIDAPRSGGYIESTAINSLEGQGGAASVWGLARRVENGWIGPFNLAVSQQAYNFTAYDAGTGTVLFNHQGTLIGGSIRVVGPQ